MRLATILFFVATALVCKVVAHGYVPKLIINGQTIPGWDVQTGMFHLAQLLMVQVLTTA